MRANKKTKNADKPTKRSRANPQAHTTKPPGANPELERGRAKAPLWGLKVEGKEPSRRGKWKKRKKKGCVVKTTCGGGGGRILGAKRQLRYQPEKELESKTIGAAQNFIERNIRET